MEMQFPSLDNDYPAPKNGYAALLYECAMANGYATVLPTGKLSSSSASFFVAHLQNCYRVCTRIFFSSSTVQPRDMKSIPQVM